MSTLSYAIQDSVTMTRRNLLHALRYPSMTVMALLLPVGLMLLFLNVFGGAMSGMIGGGAASSSGGYLNYLVPGILILNAATGSTMVGYAVTADMREGIITRFRTMAISRGSVLTGHLIGSVIQTMITIGLTIGVAILIGFRPQADFLGWVAAIAVITLATVGLTWVVIALGLLSKTVEGVSNFTMPIQFLPFLSSALVPTETMPTPLRIFAEFQPFTPVNETVRGLLTGTPIGNTGWLAIGWCLVLAVGGYLWAKALYKREPSF